MINNILKPETRIVPEEVPPKFYAEHLKPYEFLKDKVAAGKKILEVGCGDGYGSFYLSLLADEVTGIDYEDGVILAAQNKYVAPNLKFKHMDATNLQFKDKTFDIVCSFQVIEHIPEDNLLGYISEIKRVLQDNGRFYLSTLNIEHCMKSPLRYIKNAAHCKEFKLAELDKLLSKMFSTVEIYGLHLTFKHQLFLQLKKAGIFKFLPNKINPIIKFYNKITTKDFKITKNNLLNAIDFICICKK